MWNLIIPAVTTILDKVLPDAQAAADAKFKLLELAQKGELAEMQAVKDLNLAQIDVNKTEAASADPYTSRWRPTIGYVLCAALAFQYLINPLIVWYAAIWQPGITPPNIGLDDNLWELMFGVLGLAGWRTLDKIKAGAK
jgi:hypothetical protein